MQCKRGSNHDFGWTGLSAPAKVQSNRRLIASIADFGRNLVDGINTKRIRNLVGTLLISCGNDDRMGENATRDDDVAQGLFLPLVLNGWVPRCSILSALRRG